MIRPRRLLLASLLAAWAGMVLACGGAGKDGATGQQEPTPKAGEQSPKATPEERNFPADGGREKAATPAEPARKTARPAKKLIPYKVLEQRRDLRGWLTLSVVVDEGATKEEVMALAESLWQKEGMDTLNVFDSREAFEVMLWEGRNGRQHPSYPESKMQQHWLVQGYGKTIDVDKVPHWIAKGRLTRREQAAQARAEQEAAAKRQAQVEKNRPAEEERAARLKAAKEAWYKAEKDRFDQEMKAYKLAKVEATAMAKLNLARQLEADGLKRKALDRYEQIIKDFPGTQAAKDALELLKGNSPPERKVPPAPEGPRPKRPFKVPKE